MTSNQAYEARGVVGRYHEMGHFDAGGGIQIPVYRFLTLDRGAESEPMAVEFVQPAPVVEDAGETVLDVQQLREGDIVVHPGLVYRKCLMFDNLIAAHMKSLQTYKRKTIIQADKADEPAIELGEIDATTDQVTKQ